MRVIRAALSELLALFIDDGSLALAVLAWALGGVMCLHSRLLDPGSEAVLLAVGIAALLAENIARTARAHVSGSGMR
jgi:hypothetical protein